MPLYLETPRHSRDADHNDRETALVQLERCVNVEDETLGLFAKMCKYLRRRVASQKRLTVGPVAKNWAPKRVRVVVKTDNRTLLTQR
jgi:hypothetical protein